MDSLADLWVRSGKKPGRLYRGSTEDIIKELKAWVERRKAHNDARIATSWNMFHGADSVQQLSDQPSGIQQGQFPEMMIQIAAITATQMDHLNRDRNLGKEKEKETLLANFFLASLRRRGVRWPQMPCTEQAQADAGVCAFLGTVVQGFNSKTELEILEDRVRITQWQTELRRRDAVRARAIANDPIPGVNTHPIGMVGARFKEAIAKDPTKSTMQALTDAGNGIMIPGFLELIMGRSATGTSSTPNTTSETTRAAGERCPTAHNPAVYIADMLGNIKVVTSENKATTDDSNATIAPSRPSNVAADATDDPGNATASLSSLPEVTDDTAGPSSNTATETSGNEQTLSGTQGQGQGSQASKAKKKREGRKRAKARAKEASAKTEDAVGGQDNDDEEESGLVDA